MPMKIELNVSMNYLNKAYYIGLIAGNDIQIVGGIFLHGVTNPVHDPIIHNVIIDYNIDSKYRRNGITSQVFPLIVDEVFTNDEFSGRYPEIDITQIQLEINSDNIGSRKVAEKAGFKLTDSFGWHELNKSEYLENKNRKNLKTI